MSTYDEILGKKPQSSNTETSDITQYGPMSQEADQGSDYPWDGLTQHKQNVAEEPTNTQPTANTSTHQNAAVQPPKMDDVSKANATLGTPKFDKSIAEVLAKKEPTNFEAPKESETPQKQNTTSVMQEQDGPSAAQIARAYALSPTSTDVDFSPSSETQAAKEARDKSYADMIASLEESMKKNKPLTKEQEEEQRKRKKRNTIISAIGDGLTALSNLVATTKGSPNMYDPDNGLTQRYNNYYERLKADREAKRDAYLKYQNLLYNLGDNRYKELAARDASNAELRQKQNAANQKTMTDKIKLLIEADKAEASGNVAKANILRNTALANKYAEDAKWAGPKAQAYIGNQNAAAGAHRASAARSMAGAAKDYASIGNEANDSNTKNKHSVVLNNGSGPVTFTYNKAYDNGIITLAPEMARVAKKLAQQYGGSKHEQFKKAGEKMQKLANVLNDPKTPHATRVSLVLSNLRNFPQLYHHAQQALGLEAMPTASKPKRKNGGTSPVMGQNLKKVDNSGASV